MQLLLVFFENGELSIMGMVGNQLCKTMGNEIWENTQEIVSNDSYMKCV